jgi:CheY-like chemotaxis protein
MDHQFSSPQPETGAPHAIHAKSQPPHERRKKRRALISAPIRIRGVDVTSDAPDEISTTVDVSRNGILFVTTNIGFHRGMDVAVTFPYTKAPGVPQSEQPGSVVRVSDLSNGQIAVAVAFGIAAEGHLVDASGAKLETAAETGEPKLDSSLSDDPQKPLVLAVEADLMVRESLKSYLSGEGYKVIAVENATDAREVLNILTPALLIAEIEGEGLPGFDLCAHVKATPRLKHIPVMLTTGSAYPSDYSNAHSLGAVVCMAKPYRQERLGHVVRLLVAPAGAKANPQPPRAPDPTRRHRSAGLRRGISGCFDFR